MIGKTISDPNLDYVRDAFQRVFGKGIPFGTTHSNRQGVSDGTQGVQWNAGVEDKLDSKAWLGVNLEGMKYDGWPIARFIEQELNSPSLLDLCRRSPEPGVITISCRRDAWQYSVRLLILEQQVGSTPISLASLTPDAWHAILQEAYQCLDPDKHHRGRARQTVTLKRTGRKIDIEVSPHLHFSCVIWHSIPRSLNEAEASMRRGQEILRPIHEFTKKRSV